MIGKNHAIKTFVIVYLVWIQVVHSRKFNESENVGDEEEGKEEVPFNTTISRIIFPIDLKIISSMISTLEDSKCRNDSRQVITSIENRELWAMQMLDASPKFPVGMLYGSSYQLGNFDECIEIEHSPGGQYCLANIQAAKKIRKTKAGRPIYNDTLHWAICVPNSCTAKDVSVFLQKLFHLLGPENEIHVTVQKSDCYHQPGQTHSFSVRDSLYGLTILIFLVFTCAVTMYDIVHLYKKRKQSMYTMDEKIKFHNECIHRTLLSFSLVHNVGKIMETKGNNRHDLKCIPGLKFLCMLLIIPGHSLLFVTSGPVMNSEFYDKAITKVENGLFLNNPLLVDTFLFLSGFLMCRLLMSEFDKRNGRVNLLVLYICRYLRLTPSYLVVIGLYCTFLAKMDNGPLWNSVIAAEQDRCLKSWWSNILYINNYVNTDYLCMFQSWYLAADTQLFFLAPLIIYPLWRYKRLGKILLGFAIITSVVIPGVQTYMERLDPTFMIYPSEVFNLSDNFYFKNVYIKTHIRASSYCIGLLFGYLIYKLQSSSTKIPSYVNCCGWSLSILCAVASMFSVTTFYQPSYEYNLIAATAYSMFHRIGWCLAFGWIITACTTGHGGLVNKFLSWNLFMPLSRLTYCAYLVNGLIELHALGIVRQPRHMSIYNLGSIVASHLVLTFLAAFVLCVLFESPIHNLEKILLKRRQQTRQWKDTLNNAKAES